MRIAVVGAGIAGLTAAYLLDRVHDVEIFERAAYAGGHANTVDSTGQRGPIGLDTGFIVYNEHTYSGFTRLLRELGVATQPSDMSLSVRCDACRIEYSSRGLRGMLARRSDVLRPGRLLLGLDVLRFYRDTRRTQREPLAASETLGGFLARRRYSGEFVRHFILPLAAAVWSTPTHDVRAFPASYFLRFLDNHGIIGLQPAFVWRTVTGGSQHYVRAILRALRCEARLSTPVRAVRRCGRGAYVVLDGGETRAYDRVILACHADEALALLQDADADERRALGGFAYTLNRATLHTDEALLPRNLAARASWNYWTADCRRSDAELGMTFHLNRLQALDEPREYCVSLNSARVRPARVIAQIEYAHPRYTSETLAAQAAIAALQGRRNTYYAGAHLGYGFHEDGLQSAVRVAEALGVPW